MFGLGFSEILVVLCVVLLVLGPERLPDFARTLGRTMAELKRAADQFRSEISISGLDKDRDLLRSEMEELRRFRAELERETSLADQRVVITAGPEAAEESVAAVEIPPDAAAATETEKPEISEPPAAGEPPQVDAVPGDEDQRNPD